MKEARTLPHSVEAERVVISAAVNYPDVRGELMAEVQPEHFHQKEHRAIWVIVVELVNTGEPVELTAIAEYAASRGYLEDIGGVEGLVEVTEFATVTRGLFH